MDQRCLSSFVTVAETLSFQAAAARLGMSQPPLSRQIKALEEELGARLLHRGRNSRVSLTDAGEIFLKDAKQTLASMEAARRHVREVAGGVRGRLHLANVAVFAPGFLPVVLQSFHVEYPNVEVVLFEMQPPDQLLALEEGRIHLGILPGLARTLDEKFQARVLLECPMMAVLSSRHALAAMPAVAMSINELDHETFLVSDPQTASGYAAAFRTLCTAANFVPAAIRQADGVANVLSMVEAGYGVAILPETLLRSSRHACITRPLQAPVPAFQLRVVWKRGELSQVAKNFVTVLGAHAPEKSEDLQV